ncbi:MAG: G5 domain-containing protein [Anaerolineales bacterium]|nr:G5 domain-containing protein [Anaerolineales bacterium]
MKSPRWLVLLSILFLFACQPNIPQDITIIDGDTIRNVSTSARTPLLILTEAGITPTPADRVFVNGIPFALDHSITTKGSIQLQLRRAVSVILNTPQSEQTLQTSALTVGEALREAGFSLSANDLINPPAETALTGATTVIYSPAQDLVITTGEDVINIRSAAGTVGAALAEAGIPLMGLDTSRPQENEALPEDGQIRVTRVYESISIAMESIPFETEYVDSVDVAFGQEEILQPGTNGIMAVRTRIRYEDGNEVNRETEDKTVLREPQKQIVASGTKIVLAPAGGDIPYEYWFATEMYASWYSPCNSGTGNCSYGTASGAPAGFGIVAVDYSIYPSMAGMKLYIPGYGLATVGDTGGGPIIESAFGVPRTKWIDLGYNDNAIDGLSGWVTVYFLAPAPAEIPYFLK